VAVHHHWCRSRTYYFHSLGSEKAGITEKE
jgi:hypothetical protein